MITGQPDTDSGLRLGLSAESLNGGRSSATNLGDFGASQYNTGSESYPAWGAERNIPLSKEEKEDMFLVLQQKVGLQRDSMRNIVRFEYCVSRHPVLVIHSQPSSISRCTCSEAVIFRLQLLFACTTYGISVCTFDITRLGPIGGHMATRRLSSFFDHRLVFSSFLLVFLTI